MPQAAHKLEVFSAVPAAEAGRAPRAVHRAYAELALHLFGNRSDRKVIAFISANSREGVSHVVAGLAHELTQAGRRVTVLDGKNGFDAATHNAQSTERAHSLYEQLDSTGCVLIDCGSLEQEPRVLVMARRADGIVLVIEAGRMSKHQVERAAKLIEAGGNVLGCVLNKRRYPIPGWLYRIL